ncbi:hypothetical protein BU24DRAFT_453720 [Aaosphaeria arxii CBS 175.79]|uniref:Uncharacterized protein n=1 Tax=Aaosphaeria arxii CBS 175.79 TaxID=1450172 RepID=A0A6A5XH71_9PLEO|nr:uncharacterized protein BU24DRAFT_453720 [Aaosphaeria arxii CBS 175.79]KAF2012293.1 hypothetical protein BU24DRAFT_453720 [Aaosphaeria arxii CBS 175.79]
MAMGVWSRAIFQETTPNRASSIFTTASQLLDCLTVLLTSGLLPSRPSAALAEWFSTAHHCCQCPSVTLLCRAYISSIHCCRQNHLQASRRLEPVPPSTNPSSDNRGSKTKHGHWALDKRVCRVRSIRIEYPVHRAPSLCSFANAKGDSDEVRDKWIFLV